MTNTNNYLDADEFMTIFGSEQFLNQEAMDPEEFIVDALVDFVCISILPF